MRFNYRNQHFYIQCDVTEYDFANRMGFCWDKELQLFCTPFVDIIKKLYKICPDDIKQRIDYESKRAQVKFDLSTAKYSDYQVPAPKGRIYKKYQRAGVRYMMMNHEEGIGATLVADDMGLGKTIEAIGFCNITKPKRVLIICPASAKINWYREWKNWTTLNLTVGVASGAVCPLTEVIIINYDILKRHHEALHSFTWDVLIVDECHMLKNKKSQRTKEVFGGVKITKTFKLDRWLQTREKIPAITARYKAFLTGTPVENRPLEIYHIIKYLLPYGWKDERKFGFRYCGGRQTDFGMDFSGSSNTEELQRLLRSTVMLRRLKSDVLSELPPKTRQIIQIDVNGVSKKLTAEKKIMNMMGIKSDREFDAAAFLLGGRMKIPFELLSIMRKEAAIAKLPAAIKHIKEMGETQDKIIVFCHHKEVMKGLREAFEGEYVFIDGSTNMKNRQKAIDSFQDGPVKYFFGNLIAAGIAITLTAAKLVIFVEIDWVPGKVTQAEDRAHRIGQLDNVLVQHLVLRGSIEVNMVQAIVEKQIIIEQVLDTKQQTILDEILR